MSLRDNTDHLNYSRVIGEIPQHIIDRKYETTEIYEDIDQVDNFYRNVLRDDGPDPINTFADGGKRNNGGYDADEIAFAKKQGIDLPTTTASSGALRANVLSIRENGKRSMLEPRHSEAFFELTGPDPRGSTNLPNMRDLVKHSRARADNYRLSFKNDEDNSIHESARNPSKVSSDIKMAMQSSKQKLQIFEDSEVGWAANARNMFKSSDNKSKVDNVLLDNQHLDIAGQQIEQRRSNITLLSNSIPGGWSQEADHKIKVGKYNKIYSGYSKAVDIYKNRTAVDLDNKVVKSKEGYVPVSVLRLMNKHIKSRKEYVDTLPPSNRFWGKSKEAFNVAPAHGVEVQEKVRAAIESGGNQFKNSSSNARINENRSLNMKEAKLNREADVDVKLIKLLKKGVESSNKASAQDSKDLISIKHEIVSTQKNNKTRTATNASGSTATFKGHVVGETDTKIKVKSGNKVEVFNYKNATPVFAGGFNGNSVDDMEKAVLHDDETITRKANINELKMGERFNTNTIVVEDVKTKDRRSGFKRVNNSKLNLETDHVGTVYE